MTAKQYLQQLRRIAQNIDVLNEEIVRLRARIESTTIQITERVQNSGAGDALADQIASLVDKEQNYMSLLDIYEDLRQKIVTKVLAMEMPYSRILYARYVQGRGLQEIAKELCYSYEWMRHLHGVALKEFAKKYLRNG